MARLPFAFCYQGELDRIAVGNSFHPLQFLKSNESFERRWFITRPAARYTRVDPAPSKGG
jgi:hypothetical protein